MLSVTVIAEKAALADAMATAYMVMGLEPAMEHASQREELEAFFVGTAPEGKVLTKGTEGIEFSSADHSHRLHLP